MSFRTGAWTFGLLAVFAVGGCGGGPEPAADAEAWFQSYLKVLGDFAASGESLAATARDMETFQGFSGSLEAQSLAKSSREKYEAAVVEANQALALAREAHSLHRRGDTDASGARLRESKAAADRSEQLRTEGNAFWDQLK